MDKLRYKRHIFEISKKETTNASCFKCVKCKLNFYAYKDIKTFQFIYGKEETMFHRVVINDKIIFYNNVDEQSVRIKQCKLTLKDCLVKDIIT